MKKSFLFTQSELQELLNQKPVSGKHHLEPLKSLFLNKEIPFSVIEDFNVQEMKSEIHRQAGDFWICMEGEAEFTYGGELIKPQEIPGNDGNEISGDGISGGTTILLKVGDTLWIPPGEPHMHRNKEGSTVRLLIIKVPGNSND
ncbi:MAG TPA: cupin domain-containing protein [Candidatus Paceibacterota bacterium]